MKFLENFFAEKGFLATSTNQIIMESKVAIGTFYIYFDDKRAVYDYLLNDYSKRIRKVIQESIKDLSTRYEKEREGLRAFIKFSLEDRLSYRIIWESMFVERKLFIAYYTNFAQVYIKQLQTAVDTNDDKKYDLGNTAFMKLDGYIKLHWLTNRFLKKVSQIK